MAREELEFAELNQEIHERISQELGAACSKVMDALKYQLNGLPNQLAPRLVDKAPMEIFKVLRDTIHACFCKASDALDKIAAESKRKTKRPKEEPQNVLPFRGAKAV